MSQKILRLDRALLALIEEDTPEQSNREGPYKIGRRIEEAILGEFACIAGDGAYEPDSFSPVFNALQEAGAIGSEQRRMLEKAAANSSKDNKRLLCTQLGMIIDQAFENWNTRIRRGLTEEQFDAVLEKGARDSGFTGRVESVIIPRNHLFR